MTVHHKTLPVLVTENYKVRNDLAPDIRKDVFGWKEIPYNLLSESNYFTRRNVKLIYYGLLSINHLAPQIWKLVPESVRVCKTLFEFKTKMKSWYPDHCPCRHYEFYISQLGCFFFYRSFLSRPFTNHRTAGEGGRHFFNSLLPLPPALQTLRH